MGTTRAREMNMIVPCKWTVSICLFEEPARWLDETRAKERYLGIEAALKHLRIEG